MSDNNCQNGNETRTRIKVSGMSCMHCVGAVKSAIEAVPGVKEAIVDLETGFADVRHNCEDGINERFKGAVTDAGYAVDE